MGSGDWLDKIYHVVGIVILLLVAWMLVSYFGEGRRTCTIEEARSGASCDIVIGLGCSAELIAEGLCDP